MAAATTSVEHATEGTTAVATAAEPTTETVPAAASIPALKDTTHPAGGLLDTTTTARSSNPLVAAVSGQPSGSAEEARTPTPAAAAAVADFLSEVQESDDAPGDGFDTGFDSTYDGGGGGGGGGGGRSRKEDEGLEMGAMPAFLEVESHAAPRVGGGRGGVGGGGGEEWHPDFDDGEDEEDGFDGLTETAPRRLHRHRRRVRGGGDRGRALPVPAGGHRDRT